MGMRRWTGQAQVKGHRVCRDCTYRYCAMSTTTEEKEITAIEIAEPVSENETVEPDISLESIFF